MRPEDVFQIYPPSPQKNKEVLPFFYGNQLQIKMLPVIPKKEKIVVAIRWSGHHAYSTTRMFIMACVQMINP